MNLSAYLEIIPEGCHREWAVFREKDYGKVQSIETALAHSRDLKALMEMFKDRDDIYFTYVWVEDEGA